MRQHSLNPHFAAFALLLFVAARGGNWLITPMRHPNATDVQRWLVILQTILSAAGAVWFYRRFKASKVVEAN